MSHHSGVDDAFEPVERTVQLTGNSTFVVSLPKEWALQQDLESGTSMYLYPYDDRVVAAPGRVSSSERAAVITADTDGDEPVSRIRSAYVTGADRITVTGLEEFDTETRRRLERTVGRLVGIEIQESTDDRLVVADLLDVGDVSLPQTVAQARQLALEMQQDAVDAVVTNDDALARQVTGRDDDVDRLFAFVSREFHRSLEDVRELDRLGTDRTAAFRAYRTARELERIADHAVRIATIAPEQSNPPTDDLGRDLEGIAADVRTVVERALAEEPGAAVRTAGAVREDLERVDRQLYDREKSDASLYGPVVRRLERTVDNGVAIAGTAAESRLE